MIGGGTGDGAADSVTVNGTNGPDDIQIIADGSAVDVFGVPVTLGSATRRPQTTS